MTMEENELLKLKFHKLHRDLIGQNLSAIVDWLVSNDIVSDEDIAELDQLSASPRWSNEKSRYLLKLLHRSRHPRAFMELRLALLEQSSTKWIIDKLDQLCLDDVCNQKVVDNPNCQCLNCRHPHHADQVDSKYDKKVINILFLGETGVGKSTLINALANYLHFSTFSDAEAVRGFFPVAVTFTVTDPVTYWRRTVTTGYDPNEQGNGEGGSVTISPTTYVLNFGHIRVNLIDTPGVKSTHGTSQDKINAHNVLTFVSAYEKIDLICVVLKPNEARLTENFANCLQEILHNLHDSASKNVVFCVTFTKASNYGPGDTYGVLATFCSRQPKLHDLELTRRTVYCFENETVRYLAEGVRRDDERPSVERSWQKSVETTARLLERAAEVEPHSVIDTLSLNNARRAIIALCNPVVQTAKCVTVNVRELKRAREQIQYNTTTDLEDGTVEVLQRRFRFVERPYSATVCTSSGCCTIVKGIMYERVCHEHCRWAPTLRLCSAFNSGGTCIHCGCRYLNHMWSTCIPEATYMKVVLKIGEIERRKNQSIDEMTTLMDTCAELTAFLRYNSFFEVFGDVVSDCLQKELNALRPKATADKQTHVICDGLERFLETYRQCLESVELTQHKYSPCDIHEMIDALFSLPINGSELKQAVDVIQRSSDVAVKRRQKVFNLVLAPNIRNLLC